MTPPARPAPDLLTDLFRQPLDPGYAEASRRRNENGGRLRWWPVARAGRLLVLVCTGFLLAVAYLQAVASQPATSRAHADLAAQVTDRRTQADALQHRADTLRDEVARLRDSALGNNPDLDRLRQLEMRTGVARVRGDGVVVQLGDAPAPVDPVTGKALPDNPGQVLDRDLQDVTNALWSVGAEAVAINGMRLTATSTIRAAGSAILVDFQPITGPYEVAAIGPADLATTFAATTTGRRFRGFVETYRMRFSVQTAHDLVLPPAADPQLRYASRPAEPSASVSPGPSPSGGRR
jgi:uncharacterized protein YlxW (UPF0749 family)